METHPSIEDIKLVGGTLAFDFLNTRGGPPDAAPDYEALHGYEDLVAWAVHAGALTGPEADRLSGQASHDPEQARSAYEHALAVRRYLYDVFDAIVEGRAPDASKSASLRSDEAESLAHAELTPVDAGFRWSWANDVGLERPLWPIIHDAATLLVGGPLWRTKRCPGCGWWFLDESRNQSRRWCSMEDCGTAEKMRNYISRRAARRRETSTASG